MTTVQLSTKGQMVIPKELREQLNLHEGDLLSVELDGELLILYKMKEGNWQRWRGSLRGTSALQKHEREHKEEIKSEEDP